MLAVQLVSALALTPAARLGRAPSPMMIAEMPATVPPTLRPPPPSLAETLSADDGRLADAELMRVLLATSNACSGIARQLRVLSLEDPASFGGGAVNVQGETQKSMDVIANDLFTSALKGQVAPWRRRRRRP